MNKTHLRWFTRKTILELFQITGFKIVESTPRIFEYPDQDKFIGLIQKIAERAGGDGAEAKRDALPLQYLVKAIKQ